VSGEVVSVLLLLFMCFLTLVVGVEIDSRHEEGRSELLRSHALGSSGSSPRGEDLRPLEDSDNGETDECSEHGDDSKGVCGVHVLALVIRRHGHLREDGAGGKEEIRHHGRAEACVAERELASRGDGDAGAHREEGSVDGEGHDRTSKDRREDGSKDGLSGLDDVDKANSSETHRHDLCAFQGLVGWLVGWLVGYLVDWLDGWLAEERMTVTDESYWASYAGTRPKHPLYFRHHLEEEDEEDNMTDFYQKYQDMHTHMQRAKIRGQKHQEEQGAADMMETRGDGHLAERGVGKERDGVRGGPSHSDEVAKSVEKGDLLEGSQARL
jgi:hypothetical protein